MKLFKILIPKENAQTVTELQSWTVRWEIEGNMYKQYIIQHKAFIKKDEAKEFENQLQHSAKFIGAWINTEIKEN